MSMPLTKEMILEEAIKCMDCGLWEADKEEETRCAFYIDGIRTLAEALCDLIEGKK